MEIPASKHVGFCTVIILLSVFCGIAMNKIEYMYLASVQTTTESKGFIQDGSCTFPSSLTGTWYSSNGGTLSFTSTSFSNFKVASFGSYTFTCEISSGSQYVSLSEVFYVFNLPFVAYICMDMTAITGYKYSYYQPTTQLKDAEYARMKIYLNNTVSISSVSDICELSDQSVLTRHMLLKDSTISSQRIQCPDAFLGKFSYTYDTGSGNLCTQNTSLDACTDNTKMTFDYNECSEIQAYSAGGEVNCLYYTTSSSVSFLHVFNLDSTTDESTYFRFTCYVIETIDDIVYATQYPQDCHYGQNATSVNATGASLVLTASETCVPDSESTASASIGIIIAVVLLLLIIILAIIFGICMYKKKKEEEKRRKLEEERALQACTIQEKIDNPDLRPEMDLGLPDDSKYNIDRLMYSDDKMVTPSNIEIERMRSQGFQGFDDYDDGYLDDFTRQNMIDASLFLDKRQRLDPIDEFEVGDKENKTFMKRFKELARSRIKRKKKRGGKSKKSKKKGKKGKDGQTKKRLVLDLGTIDAEDWDTDEEGDGDDDEDEDNLNLPGQVDVVETPLPQHMHSIPHALYQRNDMVDRKAVMRTDEKEGKKKKKKKKKKITSKIDSYNHYRRRKSSRVEDYGDSDVDDDVWTQPTQEEVATPRLILPNLREEKTDTEQNNKKKKAGGGVSTSVFGGKRPSLSMKSFRSMRKAKVNTWTGNEDVELPLYFEDPKLKDLPPLQRVHRKKNPQLWSDILKKYGGDLNLPNDPSKLRWSENKWRNLLEELYTDKRYFDYMTKSAKHNPAERDVVGEANEGLGYLQERANFWKNQEPIPARPPSWRSNSFAYPGSSPKPKPPKKSKSFINSTSVKTNVSMSSKENSTLRSKEPPMTMLSKEHSRLPRENSMPPREHSFLSNEKTPGKLKSRERSTGRTDSPQDSSPINIKSPYDNAKSSRGTPRSKKSNLPKLDNQNTIYKMDMLPKTPMTQVRIDIEREESIM